MIESLWQFIPYLFTLVFAAAILEIILSAGWSPFYFTAGITVYRRIIAVSPDAVQKLSTDQIEAALPPSGRRAPILVRKVGINRLAFREKLFHFGIGYSPVMRGSIAFSPGTGKVEVWGYLNWYVLLFTSSLLLYLSISPPDPANIIIPLCMRVLLTYIYWMQKKRFREVEDAVLKLWGMNRRD